MTSLSGQSNDIPIYILDECGSTSQEVKKRAEKGTTAPFWVITRRQSAGYGRRSRAWQMQEGDFAGSLYFEPPQTCEHYSQYSFISALSVLTTLEDFFHDGTVGEPSPYAPTLECKWPNDILLNRKKVCGILLEFINQNTKPALCIGIGINIVSKPTDTPYPATYLKEHQILPTIENMTEKLSTNFMFWTNQFSLKGFLPIRNAWCEKTANIGNQIEVRLHDKTLHGKFEGIDEHGNLQLKTKTGMQLITAGDVFF